MYTPRKIITGICASSRFGFDNCDKKFFKNFYSRTEIVGAPVISIVDSDRCNATENARAFSPLFSAAPHTIVLSPAIMSKEYGVTALISVIFPRSDSAIDAIIPAAA